MKQTESTAVRKAAVVSECGKYRYYLRRTWDRSLPTVTFVMLNPSTADAEVDDPTIRKCMGFARLWECGEVRVVNLFALRATSPLDMKADLSPIGKDSDDHIVGHCKRADIIVAAWGTHGVYRGRDQVVCQLLSPFDVMCLGTTKEGHPRHPLYVPYADELVLFRRREV